MRTPPPPPTYLGRALLSYVVGMACAFLGGTVVNRILKPETLPQYRHYYNKKEAGLPAALCGGVVSAPNLYKQVASRGPDAIK